MAFTICPNCQTGNIGDRTVCYECGQPLNISAANRLAAGIAAKVRGDDLAAKDAMRYGDDSASAAVQRYFSGEPSRRPEAPKAGTELLELVLALAAISAVIAVIVGFIFHNWHAVNLSTVEQNEIIFGRGDPSALLEPWTVEYAWVLGIATGIQVFFVGFVLITLGSIYASVKRADHAHEQSSK